MKKRHEIVAERLREKGVAFSANDSISEYLGESERYEIQKEVEEAVGHLLKTLVIDTGNDHNTSDTAARVARMFINEVMKGRYHPRPSVTEFPNARHLNEMYTIGPVDVRSMCSHHLVPIIGKAWVGIIPNNRVIGLSKFSRIAEWVLSRPQIQEEATVQLADELEALMQPKGLGLIIKAKHLCTSWRGVKDPASEMTTSVVRGCFVDNLSVKTEFLSLVSGNLQ